MPTYNVTIRLLDADLKPLGDDLVLEVPAASSALAKAKAQLQVDQSPEKQPKGFHYTQVVSCIDPDAPVVETPTVSTQQPAPAKRGRKKAA